MAGRCSNKSWIDQLKQFESVLGFVVGAFLRIPGRVAEACENSPLFEAFDILLTRQRVSEETLPIEGRQRILVGQEPSLHHLYHEMSLLVSSTFGAWPIITLALAQVLPWCFRNRRLRIYE